MKDNGSYVKIEKVTDNDSRFGIRTYELSDGRLLFSVTGLMDHIVPPRLKSYIKNTSSKVQDQRLEETANIGNEIERLVLNDLLGLKFQVPDKYEEHFENWLKIKKDHGIRALTTQREVISLKYGFAGRLDIHGTYDGKLAIMDVKSGYVGVKAGMQEIAYGEAFCESLKEDFMTFEYVTIPIHRDGSFKEPLKIVHKDWVFRQFLNCLQSFKGLHFYRLKELSWPWLHMDAHEQYFEDRGLISPAEDIDEMYQVLNTLEN